MGSSVGNSFSSFLQMNFCSSSWRCFQIWRHMIAALLAVAFGYDINWNCSIYHHENQPLFLVLEMTLSYCSPFFSLQIVLICHLSFKKKTTHALLILQPCRRNDGNMNTSWQRAQRKINFRYQILFKCGSQYCYRPVLIYRKDAGDQSSDVQVYIRMWVCYQS